MLQYFGSSHVPVCFMSGCVILYYREGYSVKVEKKYSLPYFFARLQLKAQKLFKPNHPMQLLTSPKISLSVFASRDSGLLSLAHANQLPLPRL